MRYMYKTYVGCICGFAPVRTFANSVLTGAFLLCMGNGSQGEADWTLKWWEGTRKSKREAGARRIVPHKILVNEYSACYNMQVYFVYTAKTKRLKCRNTQSGRN